MRRFRFVAVFTFGPVQCQQAFADPASLLA
jgi:hypothetical protein